MKLKSTRLCFSALLIFSFVIQFNLLYGQSDEDCFMCHEDKTLVGVVNGVQKSMFIRKDVLKGSVHEGVDCAFCHADAGDGDFPHEEDLKPVYCGDCHDAADKDFYRGIHGQALAWG